MQDDMTARWVNPPQGIIRLLSIGSRRPDAKYCLKTDQGEYILVHSEGVRYPPGITGTASAQAADIRLSTCLAQTSAAQQRRILRCSIMSPLIRSRFDCDLRQAVHA